jgi:uncharacterized protein
MNYHYAYSSAEHAPQNGVAGLLLLDAEMARHGAKPAWLTYLAVDDVDASITQLTALGASVLMPAFDITEVGRVALLADPQGALFYIMRGLRDEESFSFSNGKPTTGHCAWNELSSSSPEGAKAFYGAHFGWSKNGELDMGELGKYEFLASREGQYGLGAVMPKLPQMPSSAWTFYFRVEDIDAASNAIQSAGGTVTMEPMQVPGGDYSLNALDPHGAAFGLVGPRISI